LVNDDMELVYSSDLDEIYAELLRLHAIVAEARTRELLERLFTERTAQAATSPGPATDTKK
jgi:hypothetical protein